MIRKLSKKYKIIFSAVTAIAIPASFGLTLSSIIDNNNNVINNASTSTAATTSETVTDNITSFSDYSLLASSNLLAPVITTDGAIGLSTSKKTLTLTTFDGILVWKLTFANNTDISNFYKTNYSSQSVSDIVVNNYVYLSNEKILVVLLGTSSYTNQIAVGVNMSTGTLFDPIPDNSTINNIVKVKDGINRLFVNSSNGIIGVKDGAYSDYVSAEYLTFSSSTGVSEVSLTIPSNLAENSSDTLYTYATGYNGVNFMTFISSTTSTPSDNTVLGSTYKKYYTVAVDDHMNPILNSSSIKVSLDVGYYTDITNVSSSNENDLWKYSTTTLSTSGSAITFFTVLGGGKSSVQILTYNTSTKTLSQSKHYDSIEGNEAFGFYFFNPSTKKLFISNKKSSEHIATSYIDLSSDNLARVGLEYIQDSSIWDSSTYVYKSMIKEFPIMSTSTLSVPDPYVVLKDGSSPIAKYFINTSDIQTYNLTFKTYQDPVNKFKTSYASELKKLPSQVNDSSLIASLSFTNSFTPTITIQDKKYDDQSGTLTFNYKVAYTNWYSTSSTYYFYIAATITGFYAKTNFQFNWITGLTGNTTENDKWNKIINLKSTKYANQITANDVINNFITYSIKDISGNSVNITSNMITLTPSSSGYSLTVTIKITGTFPTGITTQFSHTYDGFKMVSGYDSNFNDNPSIFDKSLYYPTDITLSIFLQYFVQLGDKWSTNENDWKFTINANNLNGSAIVSLEFVGSDSNIPSGTSKEIVKSKTITGFKNIPSQFKTGLSIEDYSGSQTPSQLWKQYENNSSNSKLLSLLTFPYINNKENLNITCSNTITCDTDGYLNLNITIKEGTQTSLYILGYGYFKYDSTAATAFESVLGSKTFNVKWKINQENFSFNWLNSSGEIIKTNSNYLTIDLNNVSYDGINKTMLANQVSDESINKLFTMEGYQIIKKSVTPDVTQGRLTVVLQLKQKDNVDSSDGQIITKTIIISGFDVQPSYAIKYIIIALGVVIALTLICVTIFLISFYKRKKLDYKYRTVKKNIKIKNKKRIF